MRLQVVVMVVVALPRSLIIVHDSHEGSHGLIQALNAYPCTRYYKDEAIGSSASTLRRFFASPNHSAGVAALLDVRERDMSIPRNRTLYVDSLLFYDAVMRKKQAVDNCKCWSRGLLVRVRNMDWCGKIEEDVVILTRLDLLRYAISAYGRFDRRYNDNPQFRGMNDVRHEYDLTVLKRAVDDRLKLWRAQLQRIKFLRDCGIDPFVSAYEAFDDAGLPTAFLASLGVYSCSDGEFFDNYHPQGHHVFTKVHSTSLATFASNARQVYDWFLRSDFPTFADVARDLNLSLGSLRWI